MKNIQYILKDKNTDKVLGILIGKTKDKQLVFQRPGEFPMQGMGRFVLAITSENEAKYTIEALEYSNE